MIITKLFGGLGNQMFQYAAGRRLALRRHTNLVLDISHYEQIKDRRYELDCFYLSDKVSVGGPPESYYELDDNAQAFSRLTTAHYRISGSPKRITQRGFSYDLIGLVGGNDGKVGTFEPSILKAPKNSYLVGFWQNEKYFIDYADQIRSDFTIKTKPGGRNLKLLKDMSNQNAISFHVRRGDYISSPDARATIGVLGVEYYKKAARVIAAKIDNPIFYVFSDDSEWCKKNLRLGAESIFVDNNPPDKGYEDLRLMSACKHHVIANSSFSWWGAWLNSDSNKMVIAPTRWFNDSSINTSEVVPKDWVRI